MNYYTSRIMGLRPSLDESVASFCRRRNCEVQLAASRMELQSSKHWALKVTTWLEHCQRHPETPAACLLACQDPLWLQTLRALSGSLDNYGSLEAGRTRTRSAPGKPTRYLGSWYSMINFDNPGRDKMTSRATAYHLWGAVFHGRLLGHAVM